MTRSDRLQPVAKLARQGERDAARDLGAARSREQAEEERMQDLLAYRREYLADFQRKGRAGVTGAVLQQFQQFLGQLDKAIEQQQRRLTGAGVQVSQSTQQWQQRASKAKAIDNVVSNLHTQEAVERDRREQKAVDERNQRRSAVPSR